MIWPRSLVGQVMLALAAGLFVAQAISGALLYRAGENRREEGLVNTLAIRLVQVRENPERQQRGPRGRQGRRLGRFAVSYAPTTPLRPGEVRKSDSEEQMRALFESQGITVDDVVVVERELDDDPMIQRRANMRERLVARAEGARRVHVAGVKVQGEEQWRVARALDPRQNGMGMATIAAQTLLIFAILMALMYFILRRITRPLSALTGRTRKFAGETQSEPPLEEEGPEDIRQLIAAHNAMEGRVGALLDEKDVMLGAIGHDLKTPLAALRVRIETVEDTAEREPMAQGIAEIDRTLDEILALARIGHGQEAVEATDLGALAVSIVSEFEDVGENVTLAPGPRVVHPVRPTWLKRALRNLVGNAVRYGTKATVTVEHHKDGALLRIDDDGPGIAPAELDAMFEPFARGEASRNRATGGTGLGLTIARAIAERHGGTLTLTNLRERGLRAEIFLPG